MSRDDTILILCFRYKGKLVYYVFWTRASENFESWEYVQWYIGQLGTRFKVTRNRAIALRIARRLDKKFDQPEYGVRVEYSHRNSHIAINSDGTVLATKYPYE